ncbi:probable inactive receptor-like kinase SSP [Capsella rubella]|uniref:probable inactive receptor-like kinase SSP n=1 Tax=Capsella rubella TaxID=81985 RepID=UPI000CD4BC84|nr:probable inactive receptor-like kinase SSP [Capsella rubella]
MGCCYSLPSTVDPLHDKTTDASPEPARNGGGEDPPLIKFSFYDLKMATRHFCPDNIVSEHGFDIVFKGYLLNGGIVAVKIFNSMVWSDPNQFVEEARRVGRLRHKRLVNLIGYCCDGDKRLLVADYMPYDNLAKRLSQRKTHRMDWYMRLRIACGIAEALDYCNTAGFAFYNNLSAYKVLFDEDGDACLSCFGLVKGINDEQTTTGSVSPQNVTYRYGTLLLILLSGKQIPPSHVPEMIHGKTVFQVMDPYLKGRFPVDQATAVFNLAIQCLQDEDQESPNTKEIVATLETLQTRTEVPSHEVIEMTMPQNEASLSTHFSSTHQSPSHLSSTHLSPTHLSSTHQSPSHLSSTHLSPTHFSSAHQSPSHLSSTHHSPTQQSPSHLSSTHLSPTHFSSTHQSPSHLSSTHLSPTHHSPTHLSPTPLSPLGEACSKMDLASIHKIMVSTAYGDDKDFIEVSFEEWIQEVKELQDVRKQGDQAFVEQDFKTAIACYSQFIEGRTTVYPSVYARRSLCRLFCNEPDDALLDGMAAQSVFPDWPTALYLQSVALAKLNMNTDSADTLNEASILEEKKLYNVWLWRLYRGCLA